MTNQTDVVIIGGGIVGLATAYRLQERYPSAKVTILEKEGSLAFHQSGRNSGVLHSGIYYRPGSLRATNCREGKKAMIEFCEREGVAYDICGKVIVAINESELPNLQNIFERGQANGVQCEIIGAERLHELEPHAAGIQAIHVPEAGIVDYPAVCEKLANRIREKGGTIQLNALVTGMQRSQGRMVVQNTAEDIEARCVITCAGLHCDRVAKLSGSNPSAKVVPFRGEYYELNPDVQHLCRNLIYPVADPKFPFLGVHFTRLIHGGVECGPNAVLAFAREGYTKLDINLIDLFESLTYPGFIRMAAKHWKTGCGEIWRSFSKAAFVRALQRLMPDIRAEHLHSAPSGVRAQALGRDGKLVDDFVIEENDLVVNVLNAPSPAATAALNVGRLIVDKLTGRLS